ncbi:Cell surface superoxide dismutase [Cu-Zn] 6 [Smittium mucronatum]|uniref:Cell surface superoxide dismutase [Cu-Zn] 6 n=1 Tax=Smittium mucronatum TaxID=133383 RepID=A0A1R0GZW2_9FUNG|nr:Cell surface superoxide dismutase [Cu-Zn] 6 [Smittium mucronatum]
MFKTLALLALACSSTVMSTQYSRAIARTGGDQVSGEFIFYNKRVASDSNALQLQLDVTIKGMVPNSNYYYHVHVLPVPANGSCTATLGHFDPTGNNKMDGKYKCDPKNITGTCEYGDLTGYEGAATVAKAGDVYTASYGLQYLSLDSESANSIIGRSVVIHNSMDVRISCGNIITVTRKC